MFLSIARPTILLLAAVFSGIVLFLATVLRGVFNRMSEEAYLDAFSNVIRIGRKSILINAIILIPLALLIASFFAGPIDWWFAAGGIIYVLGAFVGSRILNNPQYARLLATERGQSDLIAEIRLAINRSNIARAVVSSIGVTIMAFALFGR